MTVIVPNTYQLRCDRCGALTEPIHQRTQHPDGWITVYTVPRCQDALHFCRWQCVGAYAQSSKTLAESCTTTSS